MTKINTYFDPVQAVMQMPQKPSNQQVDTPTKPDMPIPNSGVNRKKQVKFEMSMTSNSDKNASSSVTESVGNMITDTDNHGGMIELDDQFQSFRISPLHNDDQ